MASKNLVKKKKAESPKREGGLYAKKYFQGIGRRKRSVAQVRIYFDNNKASSAEDFLINDKCLKSYFPLAELRDIPVSPLKAVNKLDSFKVSVKVKGGGLRGQAEAIRLGVSRALVSYDEEFKRTLGDLGYLTRDARMVERKKAGLKKARRAPQWQKR